MQQPPLTLWLLLSLPNLIAATSPTPWFSGVGYCCRGNFDSTGGPRAFFVQTPSPGSNTLNYVQAGFVLGVTGPTTAASTTKRFQPGDRSIS